MKPTNPSPRQILTVTEADPDHYYLRTPDASVVYEVLRKDLKVAEVRRNDRLIATIRWGWFGWATLTMPQDSRRQASAYWRTLIGWDRSVEWRGMTHFFYAVRARNERIVATYDLGEGELEFKDSLEVRNEADRDIVDELVASWAMFEYDIKRYRLPRANQSGSDYKSCAAPCPDDLNGPGTIGAATRTFAYTSGKATTTRETGEGLAVDGTITAMAFDGTSGFQTAVDASQGSSDERRG